MPNKLPEKSKPKPAAELTPPAAPQPAFALLFQLEDIAVNGRKLTYEALADLLGEQKGGFSAALFARRALHAAPRAFAPQLIEALGTKKITAEKLVDELADKLSTKLSSNSVKLDPAFMKVLQAAQAHEVAIGVVTLLPEGTAEALFNRFGFAEIGARLFPFKSEEKSYPGPDTWLKTAKAMNQRPRNCAVLCACMPVCKSALSADMRCVAVPDELTAFQDYSGADMVLEKLDEVSPKELITSLFPQPVPVAV